MVADIVAVAFVAVADIVPLALLVVAVLSAVTQYLADGRTGEYLEEALFEVALLVVATFAVLDLHSTTLVEVSVAAQDTDGRAEHILEGVILAVVMDSVVDSEDRPLGDTYPTARYEAVSGAGSLSAAYLVRSGGHSMPCQCLLVIMFPTAIQRITDLHM